MSRLNASVDSFAGFGASVVASSDDGHTWLSLPRGQVTGQRSEVRVRGSGFVRKKERTTGKLGFVSAPGRNKLRTAPTKEDCPRSPTGEGASSLSSRSLTLLPDRIDVITECILCKTLS